jgi:hypothetical protein
MATKIASKPLNAPKPKTNRKGKKSTSLELYIFQLTNIKVDAPTLSAENEYDKDSNEESNSESNTSSGSEEDDDDDDIFVNNGRVIGRQTQSAADKRFAIEVRSTFLL